MRIIFQYPDKFHYTKKRKIVEKYNVESIPNLSQYGILETDSLQLFMNFFTELYTSINLYLYEQIRIVRAQKENRFHENMRADYEITIEYDDERYY